MILTAKALTQIDQKRIRLRLAMALDCTEQWIIKLIAANKPNGPLTTEAALRVAEKETGLSRKQILESEPVNA